MRPRVCCSDTMIFTLSVPTSNDTHPVSEALYHNPRRLAKRTRHPVGCEQLYTSASVFFAGTTRTSDVLFLYCDVDQTHEVALPRSGSGPHTNRSRVQFDAGPGAAIISIPAGLIMLRCSPSRFTHCADPVTAVTFCAPPVPVTTADSVPGLPESY